MKKEQGELGHASCSIVLPVLGVKVARDEMYASAKAAASSRSDAGASQQRCALRRRMDVLAAGDD